MKVAIHTLYGSRFYLPEVIAIRFIELCGHQPWKHNGLIYWNVPPDWDKMSENERCKFCYYNVFDPVLSQDQSIRGNPALIEAIESFPKEARIANLKIVEIPDGVQWEINDESGEEWVAEKHRRWL